MDIQTISIQKISPAEYNPRYIEDEAYEALKASIVQFGQVENLIVDEDYVLIGGHQRFKAMQELGFEEVMVEVVSGLTDTQKKALNIALNNEMIRGVWDDTKLEMLLQELQSDEQYMPLQMDKLEPQIMSEPNVDQNSNKSKRETYEEGKVKQITVYFPPEVHKNVMYRMDKIKEKESLETNTELFVFLLNGYLNEYRD